MPIDPEMTGVSSGAGGASDPRTPSVPVFAAHGSGSISVTLGANGNADEVTQAVRVMVDAENDGSYVLAGYVQANGTVGGSEVYRTLAAWGTVAITGLTDFYAYTIAAKAKNEADTPVYSDWSAESAALNTLPDIDYGLDSDNLEREITTGDTKVEGVTDAAYLSISGNTVPEETVSKYYGDVTVTYKLINDDSETSSIEMEYSEDGGSTWNTATEGATGDGLTGLNTSPAGRQHTVSWDSYADSGTSEYEEDVMLRIRGLDGDGDPGPWRESAEFIISNLPGKITWEWSDDRTFGKDTTPTVEAVIPYLRGGTKGFPELTIYESDGTTVIVEYKSVESVANWEYETALNTWTPMTAAGIPSSAIDGEKRMRFTPAALAAGDILLAGRMGEVRDLG